MLRWFRRDNWGRFATHLVAMDAIYFTEPQKQFEMQSIDRELKKAYTAFRYSDETASKKQVFPIVTGNWGCGAFNGNRELKGRSIIQSTYGFQHP